MELVRDVNWKEGLTAFFNHRRKMALRAHSFVPNSALQGGTAINLTFMEVCRGFPVFVAEIEDFMARQSWSRKQFFVSSLWL